MKSLANKSMTVADIMSKDPLTVEPSETVGRADELMFENRFRQLPIVDNDELVGIITDRDIRSFLSSTSMGSQQAIEKTLNTKVREIMTDHPLTLSPDDDLEDAVELLIEEKVGGIPVIDKAEGLVGIVTYVDVMKCFLRRLQEE